MRDDSHWAGRLSDRFLVPGDPLSTKLDCNGCVHLDGFVIKQRGLIAPRLDGIQRRLDEQWMAGKHLQFAC